MIEPAFSEQEYADRLQHTRERMAVAGHNLLVVAGPANLNYLTGYDAWTFYTPQVLAVPVDGEPIFFIREVNASGVGYTTRLPEHQVAAYPETYVQQADRHPMDWIAGQLRERGLGRGRVAVEMDAYHHTARAHQALVAGLPAAEVVDDRNLVDWVRSIKSPAEIDLMRKAARIVEHVMATAIDAVRPGVRQCDAAAAIFDAQIRGVDGAPGDYTAIAPLLPSGDGAGVPHLTWTDRPFREGEATLLELAGCHRRYHCPAARTVFLGEPPRRLTDTAAFVEEGLETALAAARPGATCEEVEAAWRTVLSRSGLEKASRIGYPVGLGYPPDWGEHTMSLRPGDTTVLQPNMVFHMILGMWMDGWGYELSETFVVTDSGAECLADIPRGLTVK